MKKAVKALRWSLRFSSLSVVRKKATGQSSYKKCSSQSRAEVQSVEKSPIRKDTRSYPRSFAQIPTPVRIEDPSITLISHGDQSCFSHGHAFVNGKLVRSYRGKLRPNKVGPDDYASRKKSTAGRYGRVQRTFDSSRFDCHRWGTRSKVNIAKQVIQEELEFGYSHCRFAK